MSYVHNGSINIESFEEKYPKRGTYYENAICNDSNYAFYVTIYYSKPDPWDKYRLYAYPLKNNIPQARYTYDTVRNNVDGTKDNISSGTVSINVYPSPNLLASLDGTQIATAKVTTTLPLFDSSNEDAINNYINNGDTSGAIKDLSTDWKIYIDGEFNPLYKIHWKCQDLPNAMYSYVKFYIGEFDQRTNLIFGKDDLRILYDKNNYKTNYHDLAKIADLDTILGHQSICLIMELQYYDSPTVLPTNTSQYMYCVLHYKAIDGKMYGSYGFCELIETLVWQTTTSGKDNSTINIYDGEEGSKGYTEDNDDGYDDGKDKDDNDDDTGDVSAGIGVLTSTFKMTKERLVQLGQFLWSANIFDKFSLINNNPIENIVSCKSIPINTDGTNQEIVLGNVSTGVNGEKISNNFSKQVIGSILVNEHYHNFLDYTPYTNVILYLPYIGFKELDTTLVMNKTIQVIYTVDSITGGCLAQVYVNNVRLYEFTGNVGIDIPITASNRAQVEAGYIQAGVGATMSAVGGNVGSAVTSLLNSATSQYHYSSTGNPNPMCVASTNRTCYVIIDRPNYQNLKAFNHTRGRKCYLSKTIGSLHGFTVCDSNIDLSGINATQSELEELKEILSSGFYV